MKISVRHFDGRVFDALRDGAPVDMAEWATENDLEMEIRERGGDFVGGPAQWYAQFKHSDVKRNGLLSSAFGNGPTPDEAMRNYVSEIRGKRIVLDAFTTRRRELNVPTNLQFNGAK